MAEVDLVVIGGGTAGLETAVMLFGGRLLAEDR